MGIITLDLPVVGQPNTSEDVKIRNNFTSLQNVLNGNIDGNNLSPGILSQLGNFQKIADAIQVRDTGIVGQIRAGRSLTVNDFTNQGLSAPLGLWGLSNVNDASGNARNLTNKGAIAFDVGINGAASEAAVFTGSTGQAFYIADIGANDPFRLRSGSWGCWFNCAKRGTQQYLISKILTGGSSTTMWLATLITTGNALQSAWGGSGSATGTSDVCDGKWHFLVAVLDGTTVRQYVDGAFEGIATVTAPATPSAASPLNIGGYGADGATVTSIPYFGRVDEVFVTGDVLSQEQIQNLYCASISHTLGAVPTGTRLAVRRRKRGGSLASANFPSAPIRLHNFTAGALTDEGTGAVGLTSNPGTGIIIAQAGADGGAGNGYGFSGAHTGLSSSDTGLPTTTARSYGCWMKSSTITGGGVIGWGTQASAYDEMYIDGAGLITSSGFTTAVVGTYLTDNAWHFVVTVSDPGAVDGLKRKLYVDGEIQGSITTLENVTLGGATAFRIAARPNATSPLVGTIDGAFVFGGALTDSQIRTLYNVGSQQLALAPKDDSDHIEAMELTRVLGRFDSLQGTDLIDLAVIA